MWSPRSGRTWAGGSANFTAKGSRHVDGRDSVLAEAKPRQSDTDATSSVSQSRSECINRQQFRFAVRCSDEIHRPQFGEVKRAVKMRTMTGSGMAAFATQDEPSCAPCAQIANPLRSHRRHIDQREFPSLPDSKKLDKLPRVSACRN